MKQIILILVPLLFSIALFAQNDKNQNPSSDNVQEKKIKTTVFTLNLGEPTENALTNSDKSKRLVLPTKNPLAFKLINGNPYKYKYVINHSLVDFFKDQAYNPLDSISKLTTKSETGGRGPASVIEDTTAVNVSYVSKAKNSINIINSNKTLSSSLLISPITDPKSESDDILNIYNALKVVSQKAVQLKSEIDRSTSNFLSEDFLVIADFISKRDEFNSSYIELLSEITKVNQDALQFTEIIKDYTKKTDNLNQISESIKLEISKMFQMKTSNYLLPIDINGKNIDIVEITVERYDKLATNPTPDNFTYNIWVKGGLKIDISAGVFLTSLKDEEYETKDVVEENVTKKLIYKKDLGDLDFGAGSTINLSLRGGSWVKPAFNIGALFTANQKFQLLTGLGIIFGKEERIILHGGLSLGSIAKISGNYMDDGSQAYDLGTSGAVPTVNKFTTGYFVGVSYNFGKTKKQDKINK